PFTKIDVDCISKCDKQFVKSDGSQTTTAGNLEMKYDQTNPNLYTVECKDTLHYTTFKTSANGNPFYTATKFECDPTKGWGAKDVAEEIANFEKE
ncbi:hypothetical protein PMAYCL1PPCAC_19420, partial [Pristionchus mayeri]